MAKKTTIYADLGVDAGKHDVRATFGKVVHNDFPGAFVNIIHDPTTPGTVVTQHGDGDGSKPIQRILRYLETGDPSCFAGAVDDAVSMNMGDIAASGFLFGLTIWTDNLNIRNIPNVLPKKVVMRAFAQRFHELITLYQRQGFVVRFLGGETADLPDQIGTSVFDVTVNARELRTNVIKGDVQPGDVIFGFASDGQAIWEDQPNSGIMSNGLTLAGTCLGWKGYNEKYPFLRLKNPFKGRYKVDDTDPLLNDTSVFDAMLSPTRQWAFLVRMLVDELQRRKIFYMLHGISMNTGGGATKIGHVGSGIRYCKKMPDPSGIFKLTQREGGVSWEEMFESFNCSVGLDVVGQDDRQFRDALLTVSQKSQVALYDLGYTEEHRGGGNKIALETPYGNFDNY